MGNFAIAIHGGAGTILKENISPSLEKRYIAKLSEALRTGWNTLKKGKTAVDAVEVAVKILEDSPLFNAGKGSVFTSNGKNEMDASIMDGKNFQAGAVAAVCTIKNPISAAREVMEKSDHVLLIGKGAEKFAKESGLKIVAPSYFFDKTRWEQFQKMKKEGAALKSAWSMAQLSTPWPSAGAGEKFGTVGAVALDQDENLAAGTSTGGMTNKKFGRVGDSAVIGAGTYANNKTCAVSCTGHGEYFIRYVAAYDVSALMEYKGMNLKEAAENVILKLKKQGGGGGLIAIDAKGNITTPFSTPGMYRGFVNKDGKILVKIYRE